MRSDNKLTPFGKQVKIRLLEMDMKACDLATQIGTSPVQISRILYGKRPGKKHVVKIARLLNIDETRACE